ncbi:NAD-dependent epimerase/dehydratase family protein [Pararhizobium mangrovi]|uniref:NAD-dependent epimerase/dehydratase family protein n=1 Tax=Pararhizobium mangrovi TaxID=2590452 RepID=A0A506U0P7_9HYPH|nr:NAD-dependent epimerase/dehydratase family protein [Pararhizobium mangrovi]
MIDQAEDAQPCRILVLGGTGTIGRATVRTLVARGHDVVCLVRTQPDHADCLSCSTTDLGLSGVDVRPCDVTDGASLARDGIRGERFDAMLSCLASRTGTARAPRNAAIPVIGKTTTATKVWGKLVLHVRQNTEKHAITVT